MMPPWARTAGYRAFCAAFAAVAINGAWAFLLGFDSLQQFWGW
jgi:hypothetical protein